MSWNIVPQLAWLEAAGPQQFRQVKQQPILSIITLAVLCFVDAKYSWPSVHGSIIAFEASYCRALFAEYAYFSQDYMKSAQHLLGKYKLGIDLLASLRLILVN